MEHKYCYRVICAINRGYGDFVVYRKTEIKTEADFNGLITFIKEKNPEYKELVVINLIKLKADKKI
jgi:hypothetical protein